MARRVRARDDIANLCNQALGAIEQARKQGKIRYCGFTGHANPKVHLRVLAHHYQFDSVQMPLSVFDADDNGFQRLVLPEARKQGLAALAMKTLGGNAKALVERLHGALVKELGEDPEATERRCRADIAKGYDEAPKGKRKRSAEE